MPSARQSPTGVAEKGKSPKQVDMDRVLKPEYLMVDMVMVMDMDM